MTIPETHFIFGHQPQVRTQLHSQIVSSPEWHPVLADDNSGEVLSSMLGSSLSELHSSLAMLSILNPEARLFGNHLLQRTDYDAQPNDQFMTMSSTALQLGGLDLNHIRRTQERLAGALEETPLRFDIVDPSLEDFSESVRLRMDFDGTHYTLARWGASFDYRMESPDASVSTRAFDRWSVWDYNAEKRRQARAELDGVVDSARGVLASVQSAADSGLICEVLCTVGLLRDDHFLVAPRTANDANREGSAEQLLAFRASPEGQSQMHSYNQVAAERTAAAYKPLAETTEDIDDPTQLALLRYWYATEVGVVGFFANEDTVSREQRISGIRDNIKQKIAETAGAGAWPVDKIRSYVDGIIDAEAQRYTANYQTYFNGHDFKSASGQAGLSAGTEYPELNEGKRNTSLQKALALVRHTPPPALLEAIRSLDRLDDDMENTDDDDRYVALRQERKNLIIEIDNSHGDYWSLVQAAEQSYAETFDFVTPIDDRLMIIEGIQLARQLVGTVDSALSQWP